VTLSDLELGEQMEDNLILARLEEISNVKPTLFEAKGGMNLKFCFGSADLKNANKRTYPMAVFSKGIMEAQAKIEKGSSLFGSCDHKDVMGIADISHRLTKLSIQGKDGIAECAVLKTAKGNDLIAIVKGGGVLGASMRGIGSVKEGIVQDDWKLEGVDMVLGPSFDVHVSSANVFESEELSPELITEGLEGRYAMALKAGFKGSLKDYMDGMNAEGDDEKITALFAGAVRAGYRKGYLEFRKEYLARRKS